MKLPKHPLALKQLLWPDVYFYAKQREMIESVWFNDETNVYAANLLGKDFVAGFICLSYFLLHHGPTVRVVTTSVREDHLTVLWGEIGRFIQTSKYPLLRDKGGPLVINYMHISKVVNGQVCPISYLKGLVSKKGEGMAGHHADYAMMVGDEASGIDDSVFEQSDGWNSKRLFFGNPNQCTNRYRTAERDGDIPHKTIPGRYHRRNIRIRAEDSPNVRLALAQIRLGQTPTNEVLVPGIIRYEDGIKGYRYRRDHWDKVRQSVGLDGRFWEGSELLMYPPDWLNRAEAIADTLKGKARRCKGMGVDPGEGEANTVWTMIDEYGLIEQISYRTPDTSVINPQTLALIRQYNLEPEQVCYDRGGGGKQLADRLRSEGHYVRTVGFGESLMLDIRSGMRMTEELEQNREQRYAYKNRRAQMYAELMELLDPNLNEDGFGIGSEHTELRRQMAPIPKTRDKEGSLYILPKNRRDPNSRERTLTELLGCSPDELDSLVLAVFAMRHEEHAAVAGAL